MLALAVGTPLIVLAAGLVLYQRHLIYPLGFSVPSEQMLPSGWTRVPMPAGGMALHGSVSPWRNGAPTAIMFHGNAVDPWSMAFAARDWSAKGWNVVLAEYPGYDGNPGSPSEASMKEAARGAWRFVRSRGVAPERIVIVGNSIGSGPAAALAAETSPAGLLLVSGVADMGAVVRHHVPMIPLFLLKDRWRNVSEIGRSRARLAVWHGTADVVVPYSQGIELARGAGVRLRTVRGVGHDLFWFASLQRDLLAEATRMVENRGMRVQTR